MFYLLVKFRLTHFLCSGEPTLGNFEHGITGDGTNFVLISLNSYAQMYCSSIRHSSWQNMRGLGCSTVKSHRGNADRHRARRAYGLHWFEMY